MKTRFVLLAGVTLLAVTFGSVGIALAQAEDGPQVPAHSVREGARVYGLLESIGDEKLTLATPVGAVTLVTDANTRFRIPGVEEAGLDDLAAGDTLAASGWWEQEENTFHAFGVLRLESDHTLPLAGKLETIGDDTLTVETGRGVATVHVSDETEYRIQNVEQPGRDDLEEGMRVIVKGTLDAGGSLLAQTVAVPHVGPRQGRLQGEVVTVEGDTLTIRAARGREFTVLTDETTEFRVPDVDNPSIADLAVGDRIAGEGEADEDGMRATLVIVLPEQATRLNGEAFAVNGTTLMLDTPGGQVNVLTDADTVVRIPGVEEPALGDIEIGARVTAAGTWDDAATFRAFALGEIGGRRAGQPGAARGRVISVRADNLVLGTPQGPVTVLVDAETQYRAPDVETPSLDDITTGDSVGVRGVWNEDGTLQATVVAAGGGKSRGAALRDRMGHKHL